MSPPRSLSGRHLLGIASLEAAEIELILETAESFREVSERDIKKVPALRGRTVINLFLEPSTRTRVSFEIAAQRLSADVVNIAAASSSIVKGETLADTARTLDAMRPDVIVIRHSEAGAAHLLARHVDAHVVNAGDGAHEHPTQALLDAMTIRQKLGRLAGLRVVIIGDLLHSRVARSNIQLLTKLGSKVVACGPPALVPQGFEALGVERSFDLDAALVGADVAICLRMQLERMQSGFAPNLKEYARRFSLTAERLDRARPDLIVMHPGPMNRGVEIASEVADGPRSVIFEQVKNGVATRMAVLFLLCGGEEREGRA